MVTGKGTKRGSLQKGEAYTNREGYNMNPES